MVFNRKVKFKDKEAEFLIKDQRDHIQQVQSFGGFYEAGMLDYIYNNYQGKVFVDIGSHIGNHVVFYSKICNAQHVYAFEPLKDSYQHLIENIDLNGVQDQVTSFNVALGYSNQEVGLSLPKNGNSGMYRIDVDKKGIQMTTLDSLVMACDVIKIDVEGYNLPVLLGAERLIMQCKPDIFVECENIISLEEADYLLQQYGYKRTEHKFNATPTYLWKKST